MKNGLSSRGADLVETPTLPAYLLEHFARSETADPADPQGYIPFCIAENRLVWDLLSEKVNAARDVPAAAFGYDDMVGSLGFRKVLAGFLGSRVLGRQIAAEQLAVLAGAGSVLEVLFYALADPTEGVLVPTPSYAGFWMDLEVRDALQIVPVYTSVDDGCRLTTRLLDEALAGAPCAVRALLFTTPNNPLGTVYTREELEEILSWAEHKRIHVVFDEVYALSVFGERAFVSAATLRPALGDFVHVVWAFSKDFAASGLRCGVLFSENPGVLAAVSGLAYWSACSGDTLHLLRQWISDEDWLDRYIAGMRQRLGLAYATVTTHLTEAGLRFLPGGAGFFVLVDLRPFLDEPSWAAEDRLWRRLLDGANVNLTPGVAIRSAEPGIFRLCFASVSPDVLQTGLDRLTRVLLDGDSA